jgi:DNA-binding Lrp family transcriptional regulator
MIKWEEIQELYPLFGDYDLIAKIQASDYEGLSEIVVNKIRALKGVNETKTLTGAKF